VTFARDEKTVRDVALIHVGRKLIEKTLKRLRSLSPQQWSRLHRIDLALSWTRADLLPAANGDALLAAIRRHIGSDIESYRRAKASLIDTVGFEERRFHGRFTIKRMPRGKYLSQLADLAVGLRDTLPVQRVLVREMRFGIPRTVDDSRGAKSASISIPNLPNAGKATISITNIASGEVASIEFDTYAATSVFPFLPKGFRKLRFVAPFLSLLRTDADPSLHLSFNVPPQAVSPIGDLARAGAMARVFAEGAQHGLRYDIEFKARGSDQTIHGSSEMRAKKIRVSPRMLRVARALENAGFLTRYFNLPDSSPAQAAALVASASNLEICAQLFSGQSATGSFSLRGVSTRGRRLDGALIGQIVCPGFLIGNHAVMITLAVLGRARWAPRTSGGDVEVEKGECRIMSKNVVPRRRWRPSAATLQLEAAAATLRAEGIAFLSYRGKGSDFHARQSRSRTKS
jgi:hypothetical protein